MTSTNDRANVLRSLEQHRTAVHALEALGDWVSARLARAEIRRLEALERATRPDALALTTTSGTELVALREQEGDALVIAFYSAGARYSYGANAVANASGGLFLDAGGGDRIASEEMTRVRSWLYAEDAKERGAEVVTLDGWSVEETGGGMRVLSRLFGKYWAWMSDAEDGGSLPEVGSPALVCFYSPDDMGEPLAYATFPTAAECAAWAAGYAARVVSADV
jgi:hypothetical protein